MNTYFAWFLAFLASAAPALARASDPVASREMGARLVRAQYQSDHDRDDRDRDDDDHRYDRGYRNRNGYGRHGSYYGVLSPEYQQRFDSYYTRWLQYRAANNRGEMESMERRMQDIMTNYRIPSGVPYDQVASPGIGRGGPGYYRGRTYGRGDGDADDYGYGYGRNTRRLSADDQRRFDSYYSRWVDYRRRNDRDEVASMEGRMRDIMNRYQIPANVPFSQVASQGGYR